MLDGKLYAVGGGKNNTGEILLSAERYDPTQGVWEEVAPIPKIAGGADMEDVWEQGVL